MLKGRVIKQQINYFFAECLCLMVFDLENIYLTILFFLPVSEKLEKPKELFYIHI